MGRWHGGEGGLPHCEGIRQAHRRGEVGATRSATDQCSALPCFGRRVGADPISLGAYLSSNDRTISWLQAADSINIETGQTKTLVEGGTHPRYSPSGHLLYARGAKVFPIRFAANRLRTPVPPFP